MKLKTENHHIIALERFELSPDKVTVKCWNVQADSNAKVTVEAHNIDTPFWCPLCGTKIDVECREE